MNIWIMLMKEKKLCKQIYWYYGNITIDIQYRFIIWINGNKALGNWYHYALNMMIHPKF
jgi:hypothetical protein